MFYSIDRLPVSLVIARNVKARCLPKHTASIMFESMGRGFLGFGQNLGEILPTSLPELPIQLRDLRNNQKSLKNQFVMFHSNSKLKSLNFFFWGSF